eukprot:scaffold269110_cov65-Attheya_sp.AAC.1
MVVRLGRQVVQNAGKLNIPSGPTSDRHTALQTNGLPHTVRRSSNTNAQKNNPVIGTFYTTLYQIVRHWRATAHNIINAIRSEKVATMAYIS